jgi:hypothetical protein
MDDTDSSERTQELKEILRDELKERDDVKDYEFVHTADPGIHLVLEQEDETRRYHVTLERHPDGEKKTHWNYLGPDKDD